VLFNIFGGITRCDEVARGIVTALQQVPTQAPMVVRLVGTNEEEGRAILAGASMQTASTLVEAAQKAVAAAKGEEYVPSPAPPLVVYKPKVHTVVRPVTRKTVKPIAKRAVKPVAKKPIKKTARK
jgi:hypothetical protein